MGLKPVMWYLVCQRDARTCHYTPGEEADIRRHSQRHLPLPQENPPLHAARYCRLQAMSLQPPSGKRFSASLQMLQTLQRRRCRMPYKDRRIDCIRLTTHLLTFD